MINKERKCASSASVYNLVQFRTIGAERIPAFTNKLAHSLCLHHQSGAESPTKAMSMSKTTHLVNNSLFLEKKTIYLTAKSFLEVFNTLLFFIKFVSFWYISDDGGGAIVGKRPTSLDNS